MTLDAKVDLAGPKGRRTVPLNTIYIGFARQDIPVTQTQGDGKYFKVFARQFADFQQFSDFRHAIREGVDPVVSGREGRRSVELLERCYRERLPLIHPWEHQN